MIAAWMLYALLVGVLFAAAAWCGDVLLRLAGRPTRLVWAAALVATIGFVANAPRERLRPAAEVRIVPMATTVAAAAGDASPASRWDRFVGDARDAVVLPVRRLLRVTEQGTTPGAGAVLLGGWSLVVVIAALVHLAAYRRIGRARREWPAVELEGGPVRLARDMGPAVVGLAKPEVVVPRWLLDRPSAERRLVLAHEREHVRAHDPLLLAAGCAAAVLLAWHPAAWWMLARLRLAVETDCDRRVLRSGTATRPYATLLIELAGHDAGLPAGAPALAGRRTHLERRLLAMTTRTTRFPLLRGGALAAVAASAILAACESRLPTAAEVEKMDVAAVEQRVLFESGTEYYVDGVRTTPEQARNLAPDAIRSVRALKASVKAGVDPSSVPSRIEISTMRAGLPSKTPLRASGARGNVEIDSLVERRSPGTEPIHVIDGVRKYDLHATLKADSIQFRGERVRLKSNSSEVPLFIIDGRTATPEEMHKLAPNSIESVEVLKSELAKKLHGEAAIHGVVKVTTKKP